MSNNMSHFTRKISGITLIEVMVTLIIIGILVGLTIPAYNLYLQNSRAIALTNDFMTSLALARNEALTRDSPVTICPAANAALNSCGSNVSWTNGWIVFVDPNADGIIANDSERLQVHDALELGTTFTTTVNRITYNGIGFATSGTGVFNIAATGCTGNNGRTITISATGRANSVPATCS